MKMFIIYNLNHSHPAEYEHFKDFNKGKVGKAKAVQSSKPTIIQQPQYEQHIKAGKLWS